MFWHNSQEQWKLCNFLAAENSAKKGSELSKWKDGAAGADWEWEITSRAPFISEQSNTTRGNIETEQQAATSQHLNLEDKKRNQPTLKEVNKCYLGKEIT